MGVRDDGIFGIGARAARRRRVDYWGVGVWSNMRRRGAPGRRERTVRRRLHGSEFRAEVERLQAQTIQGIAAELKSAASKATATLTELLDPSVADTVRLAAARVILDATTRYHDIGEIEERVRDIEIELYDDNDPRRSA
jgi:hypothetical protein